MFVAAFFREQLFIASHTTCPAVRYILLAIPMFRDLPSKDATSIGAIEFVLFSELDNQKLLDTILNWKAIAFPFKITRSDVCSTI
jgi:hypothetical protein